MTQEELRQRLKDFAIRIIKMSDTLPLTPSGQIIGKQVVRSGTSPGANYRAACLGKSDKDFLNKLKMVEEELDETAYWLELIIQLKYIRPELMENLYKENIELLKIIVRTITTMKKKIRE